MKRVFVEILDYVKIIKVETDLFNQLTSHLKEYY